MSSYNECRKCGEKYTKYTNAYYRWCKSCQINNLKTNFINWTSKNEKINELVQKMQLKIEDSEDIVFEWIPYNQFDNIEEISKGDYATIYSATWKNGPLNYNYDNTEYIRKSDKNVALKCLHNSQDITNEFLDEV